MNCFDSHIHTEPGNVISPDSLIRSMEAAGVYGGALFSYDPFFGCDLDERLESLFQWVGRYTDRLFPFFWIHPREDDVMKKIRAAIDAGVRGFKMIPTDYSVTDDDVLEVIRVIAAAGKPITFHSGILHDYELMPTSVNNRPILWENLLKLDCPVRFALAHISWPWTDECLAVLGKMRFVRDYYPRHYGDLYETKYRRKLPDVEMMIDTAPGASSLWREDAFRKMFLSAPSGRYFMFGTDCFAHDYNAETTKKLIEQDSALCKAYATDDAAERYFGRNFLNYIDEE